MLLELEMSLGDEGDIKLTIDTDQNSSIVLTLTSKSGSTTVENIEPHRLGQFVVNARRYLTMAHEDDVLTDDEDDD